MNLRDAIEKLRDITRNLESLPKLGVLEEHRSSMCTGYAIRQKRKKICEALRPFLEKIRQEISNYQSAFSEEVFAETKERYENVKKEVDDLAEKIKSEGLVDKILDTRKLLEERDVLYQAKILDNIELRMDEKQLEKALLEVGVPDTMPIDEKFYTPLLEEALKDLSLPSEKEIRTLSRIYEVLEGGLK